jgi:transcriptional regulator with XRE-family HTH domain
MAKKRIDTDDLSDIGKRVYEWLGQKSLYDLEEETGVPESTLRRNLKKGADPKTYILDKIARSFNRSLDELIRGERCLNVQVVSDDQGDYAKKYRSLEENILYEIQEWLTQVEKIRPGQKVWFHVEFENRFPEFSQWRQKKRAGNDH